MTLREIDRLIAEKVFGMNLAAFGIFDMSGYRLRDRDFDSREEAEAYVASEDERMPEAHKSTGKIQILPCVRQHPNFSSDAYAAKQLRMKLAEKWDWILGSGKTHPKEPQFGFALYSKDGDHDVDEPDFAAETDTSEELAICLAALHSVGHPVEGEIQR